jgi:FixJ family two-component response regulator
MVQTADQEQALVYVVDDDVAVCDGIKTLLESMGMKVKAFNSANDFLLVKRQNTSSCLLLDVRLPGMSGLDFQLKLTSLGIHIPIVFMTGHADVPMGVQAMKAGAVEFLCKPFRDQDLLDAVTTAIERDRVQRKADQSLSKLQASYGLLTPREREVMGHVVSGFMNKQIAAKLGISDITVKVHRASVIRKMGAKSLAELVRMADALNVQSTKEESPHAKA